MPLKWRLLIWLITKTIENRDYTWLLAKVVRYISLHIRFDHEDKKWEITSERAFDPAWQKIDYSDIEHIFKSDISGYHVHEERYSDGRFKKFTVETQ